MIRAISRCMMLFAALLFMCAAGHVQAQLTALISWGVDDQYGQVSNTPKSGTYSAVSTGLLHTVAIRTDGTLVSWGSDYSGLLSGTPVGTYSAVAAGGFHSVAIRTDGTLVSWGHNPNGLVSQAPTGPLPGAPPGSPNQTFTAVSATLDHALAIRTDGTLVAWGANDSNEVSPLPDRNLYRNRRGRPSQRGDSHRRNPRCVGIERQWRG